MAEFARRVPRYLIVYALGVAIFAVDLWVPLDIDTPIFYSIGIVACGRLRSRRHLWLATALFIAFGIADLVIGAPPILPESPRWIFISNRTILVLALLLLAWIVDLWIRSVDAVERQQQRLARQNEELETAKATLEERVRERTVALETASQERQDALAALYQAQKMEAVGQLTGGVAHDINNLLTVIGGNTSILLKRAPDALRARLETISHAVDHGAKLTRQLLAFARRQKLNPETLDLREQARSIIDMMGSSLRENVRVVADIPEGLWPVEVDAAQLQLALLNIGINARDAMPEGRLLSIGARNVAFAPGEDRRNGLVGDFVALTLSDEGAGIAPDTLERVFEPFFTTKPVGKGSGLGLSQVYGFAKQSGGAVAIHSEPGHGTAVTLYLPRAARPARRMAPVMPAAALHPGAGRVLYVEDNPAVAEVTREMLAEIGFEVLWVEDAAAALRTLAEHESFDVLLTDILMPGGVTGVELARESRSLVPGLPVLLTSGHGERSGKPGHDDFDFLRKPYTGRALAKALSRCIAHEQQSSV